MARKTTMDEGTAPLLLLGVFLSWEFLPNSVNYMKNNFISLYITKTLISSSQIHKDGFYGKTNILSDT